MVRAVADASRRWVDADYPPRVRATAAIEARLGYTIPVVDYALDRLFETLTAETLEATIASELGALDALDGFVARPGRPRQHALGLDLVAIVSSDTTIGVAIVPFAFALCAKCGVTVKDRSDGLVAAFAATLAEEEPALGAAATVADWPGGDAAVEAPLFADAACVVAFGNDATLAAIRARLQPGARFVGFGHRASVGYVGREALASEADALRCAEAAALDALLYDGESCMSLHALGVERGGRVAAERFVELLAGAAETVATEFPAGPLAPARAARVASYRNLAAFRAAGGRGRVFAGGGATIVFDPPREAPPFLPRTLDVRPYDDPQAFLAYLCEQRLPLEAFAVAPPVRDEIRAAGVASGAARIAPLGTLQRPPLGRMHGGRPRIMDFVRWIDDET